MHSPRILFVSHPGPFHPFAHDPALLSPFFFFFFFFTFVILTHTTTWRHKIIIIIIINSVSLLFPPFPHQLLYTSRAEHDFDECIFRFSVLDIGKWKFQCGQGSLFFLFWFWFEWVVIVVVVMSITPRIATGRFACS